MLKAGPFFNRMTGGALMFFLFILFIGLNEAGTGTVVAHAEMTSGKLAWNQEGFMHILEEEMADPEGMKEGRLLAGYTMAKRVSALRTARGLRQDSIAQAKEHLRLAEEGRQAEEKRLEGEGRQVEEERLEGERRQVEEKRLAEEERQAGEGHLAGRSQTEEERREEPAEYASSVISYSQKDYEVLQRIVEAEAGICDAKGRILVANVIINRVRSKEFPDTITGVVYQKSQFSPVQNGRINSCVVSPETVEAVDRALAGEDYSQGALYFMNRGRSKAGNVSWFDQRLTYLFQHDGHEFFR